MPPPDFFFALDVPDQADSEQMMDGVIGSVLKHAGFDAKAAAEIAGELRRALADAVKKGARRCGVTFEARAGTLSIAVAGDRGSEWRTARPLP
ncbi:MAG TPA: hypothetical protein VEU08_21670 [Vicinamibacterales bacterium]|nr:hypothetical protein [Vicinamibacterales bacterium]